MDMRKILRDMGVRFNWSHHERAYTAQKLARLEHVSGKRVVKPVVVNADGRFVLCALPANYYVDLERLRQDLHAEKARLADEPEFVSLFADCELGAEPPIGRLFGMKTMVDESLMNQKDLTFQAGTHEDAVTMSVEDYVRLAEPVIGHFGKERA
jgi:Ala-tRNA(Pro) deacylase